MTASILPRRVDRTEVPAVAPARELVALFDLGAPFPAEGTVVPLLGHWMYFHEHPRPYQLDGAGLPTTSDVVPAPVPGARRLLGGGSIEFCQDLILGTPAVRSSKVTGKRRVRGRSGDFAVTVLEHTIIQKGRVCIRETEDVLDCFGAAAFRPAASTRPGGQSDSCPVDAVSLFRFSALMRVPHRIHWDEGYARSEGYSGLVVPGPYQLIAAVHRMQERRDEAIRHIRFRYISPLTVDAGMSISLTEREALITDSTGRATTRVEVVE